MSIKFKKIDTTLIVVIEGNILTRELPQNEPDKFLNELEDGINLFNSGTLNSEDQLFQKASIISKMKPKKVNQTSLEFVADKDLVEKETDDLALKGDLEKAKRIADISGNFEYDSEGKVYLKGFSVPIPIALADALLDARYNPESKFTVESLTNFWQWAVLNPNPKARIDLFSWFQTGEFVITEQGLIVAYRNVNVKQKGMDSKLEAYINEAFIKVKKHKQSPKNYVVLKLKDGSYKSSFLKSHPEDEKASNNVGNLAELYANLNTDESATVYTDNHTGKMTIKMGEEVSMPREDCDENHNAACSSGLHFMSPSYGLRLGSTTIVILVNPYNIVAFPSYDQTKGRCCAYLPIGKAEKKDGKIIELQSGSYDFEYSKYTSDTLKNLIENGSLEDLQEKGLISSDLTEDDFNIVKSQVSDIIKSRVINV